MVYIPQEIKDIVFSHFRTNNLDGLLDYKQIKDDWEFIRQFYCPCGCGHHVSEYINNDKIMQLNITELNLKKSWGDGLEFSMKNIMNLCYKFPDKKNYNYYFKT